MLFETILASSKTDGVLYYTDMPAHGLSIPGMFLVTEEVFDTCMPEPNRIWNAETDRVITP